MENNNNKIKLFKRFLKDIGQYQNFKQWVMTRKHYKNIIMNNTNKYEYNYTLKDIYASFSGETEYNNTYTIFLTKKIGTKKTFQLFKNFLLTNYGKKVLDDFKKNISANFIKEQTQGMTKLNKKNTILSLPATAYLMYGFHWEESPQGHDFWSQINQEWDEISETILTNYIYENNIT